MSFETFYPGIEPMVETIAWEFGGKGRQYGAEGADFRQEFVCWLLEHEDAIDQWYAEGEVENVDAYIARCLRNEAKDYLVDIKAQACGYSRDDEYFYTRGEVKALLGDVFNPESWTEPPQYDGVGGSGKAPSEGGNWIATLADVAQAFERLKPADKELLQGFHRDGWTNKMMAMSAGVTEATMSARHNAAVGRLQRLLGGDRPSPRPSGVDPLWRGRHAVSAESARAYQSRVYDSGATV